MNRIKRVVIQGSVVLAASTAFSFGLQALKINSLKRQSTQQLDVKIAVSEMGIGSFSIQHRNSGFNINQVMLNPLVSTLVKYDSTGRIAPYLAKNWAVSKDKKIWRFEFAQGLTCENGKPITPDFYKKSLVRILKKTKNQESAAFSNLEGWSQFKKGKTEALGLYASKNFLYMEFTTGPEDLLDLLRLPSFGTWCASDEQLFVSSGPFKIKSFRGDEVVIERRSDWQLESFGNIKLIKFSFLELDKINKNKKSQIVKLPYGEFEKNFRNSFYVSSVPDRMEGLILSPNKHSLFAKLENRKIFRDRLRSLAEEYELSQHFYVNNELTMPQIEKVNYASQRMTLTSPRKTIRVGFERINYTPSEIATLKTLLQKIFSKEGFQLEFEMRHPKSVDFMKRSLSNNYFDIRVSAVGIGAGIQTTSLAMIFCSDSNINFPDPSGRICSLVRKQSQQKTLTEQEFLGAFHQILKDDAAVMPLYHHQESWLVSKNIDPSGLTSSVIYPRFENLVLNLF
jgi:ABC-type oligopeptide transport system substrate-binding subunit